MSEKVSIELDVFEWHLLLRELDNQLRVINRDKTNAILLFESIASQLSDKPVKVVFQDEEELSKPKPIEISFWHKIFKKG